MGFRFRLIIVLGICTALACSVALGFVIRLMAVFATCAALAAGVMLNRRSKFRRLTSKIPAEAGKVLRLNDSLYELYRPNGTSSMEILFFHGFQRGDYKDAHISTWKTGDGSCVWPQVWLPETFPGARILSVAYNAAELKKSDTTSDMHIISENLMRDLLLEKIGQEPCRPVILVGHSFGGLVIKQLCVYASREKGILDPRQKRSFELHSFLENITGIFFYSTPHHGISDNVAKHFVTNRRLLEYVKTLSTNTERLNSDFDRLCGQEGACSTWQIKALGEGCPTDWSGFHSGIVVEEPSSRYGSFSLVVEADHISVCRPMEKISSSFSVLKTFIEGIAVHSQAMVHGLPDYSTSLKRRAYEVQLMLRSSAVLGIVGMGGIGKTSIAKEVFKNIGQQFEYTCLVDNVKGIKPHKLNDWILSHFLRTGSKASNTQWSGLHGKKTLIVMDDVDSDNQFKPLPEMDHFGAGSRLIVTSRKHGVLTFLAESVIYEVEFLNFDEAKKLFCNHAFSNKEGIIPDKFLEINPHLEENVRKVVTKCDGLPLTLEVMGCYLKGKETKVWEQAVDQLGNAGSVNGDRDDKLWASLRLSYDALCEEEQQMFIDAGAYFVEQPVALALAAWSTAYGHAERRWANLLSTSMVKEVDGWTWTRSLIEFWNVEEKHVWVHEQLRDLAKTLSNGTVVDINMNGSSAPDCPNANPIENQLTSKTTSLRLHKERSLLTPATVQLEILDDLEDLKCLEGEFVLHDGPSSNFPRNLSLLKWHNIPTYNYPYIPMLLLPIKLQEMKNLAVLQLGRVTIREEGLQALGSVCNLRILSLFEIEGLYHLPANFGDLYHLKHLTLENVDITDLPESFGKLSCLTTLRIAYCERLKSIPESFGSLSLLTHLAIKNCGSLRMLPSSLGLLSSMKQLELCLTHLQALPDSFDNLAALTNLTLDGCRGLKRLPASFGLLSALQELVLRECGLRKLPDNFGQLSALESLSILKVNYLKVLPDSFGNLSSLDRCRIGAKRLQSLPESIGNLHALRALNIYGESLRSLPEELCNLSSLEILGMRRCRRIRTLPESLGRISSLRKVTLVSCSELASLPDSLGKHFSCPGDRSTAMRGSVEGQQCFQKASTKEFFYLRTLRCRHLHDSALRSFGWVEINDEVDSHLKGAVSRLRKCVFEDDPHGFDFVCMLPDSEDDESESGSEDDESREESGPEESDFEDNGSNLKGTWYRRESLQGQHLRSPTMK